MKNHLEQRSKVTPPSNGEGRVVEWVGEIMQKYIFLASKKWITPKNVIWGKAQEQCDEYKARELYTHLYNNQINGRALIGQSAVGYCAGKPREKSRVFWISNYWTEWSTIQGVIARVISKSDEREARGRFEITSTITPWIVHEVQLLINRVYNKFRN